MLNQVMNGQDAHVPRWVASLGKGRRIGWMVFLGLLLLALGCQAPMPTKGLLVPVTGTVRLDGEPVVDARIVFIPTDPDHGIDWQLSYGRTDARGHYELKTRDGATGALVGPHLVVISKPIQSDSTKEPQNIFIPELLRELQFEIPDDQIPGFYNRESSLQFVVAPEQAPLTVDWDLSSIDPLLKPTDRADPAIKSSSLGRRSSETPVGP